MEVGKLFVIATPLGHRDDITLRALETLRALSVLFAEDTRELRKLLSLHGISASGKSIHSYAQHNLDEGEARALEILEAGKDVGLVTDRGTPAVSDPGAALVRRARDRGVPIVPVPGPSSLTAALSVSGIEGKAIAFLGFLPKGATERRNRLERQAIAGNAIVLFESPHRVRATVAELETIFPGGKLFVAREMTKAFEELAWHDLDDAPSGHLEERGEYCLIVLPSDVPPEERGRGLEQAVRLRACSEKEWAKAVAERLGVPSKAAYDALQQAKRRD